MSNEELDLINEGTIIQRSADFYTDLMAKTIKSIDRLDSGGFSFTIGAERDRLEKELRILYQKLELELKNWDCYNIRRVAFLNKKHVQNI